MRHDRTTSHSTTTAMPDTLPKSVSTEIRSFCRSISEYDPIWVRCRPDRDAVPSECFDNVARKVPHAGGSVVSGWAIWTTPGVYFEAEHHGVWRRRTGELVDVSPQPNLPKRILFLPDPEAVYDPLQHRDNVLVVASNDPAGIEFVALGNRRNQIHGAYQAGGNRLALFTQSDQKELGEIETRPRTLSAQLLRSP